MLQDPHQPRRDEDATHEPLESVQFLLRLEESERVGEDDPEGGRRQLALDARAGEVPDHGPEAGPEDTVQ